MLVTRRGDIEPWFAVVKRIAVIEFRGEAVGVLRAVAGADSSQALHARKIRQHQGGPEEFHRERVEQAASAHVRSARGTTGRLAIHRIAGPCDALAAYVAGELHQSPS